MVADPLHLRKPHPRRQPLPREPAVPPAARPAGPPAGHGLRHLALQLEQGTRRRARHHPSGMCPAGPNVQRAHASNAWSEHSSIPAGMAHRKSWTMSPKLHPRQRQCAASASVREREREPGTQRRNPRARGSSRLSGSPLEPLQKKIDESSSQLKRLEYWKSQTAHRGLFLITIKIVSRRE